MNWGLAGWAAPFVLKGDTLTADRFWMGARMTEWAEKWVPYWTKGEGRFTTSAEEDTGYLLALVFLAHAGRVDLARARSQNRQRLYGPARAYRPRSFSKARRRATTPPTPRRSRTPMWRAAP
jgi:hypothetical protein